MLAGRILASALLALGLLLVSSEWLLSFLTSPPARPPGTLGPPGTLAAPPGPPIRMLQEGGATWRAMSAAERAAVRRARGVVAAGGDRAAALKEALAALEHPMARYLAAKELSEMAGRAVPPPEAVTYAAIAADLAPEDIRKLEARALLGDVLLMAGRPDEAAGVFLALPSDRPAGPDADHTQEWNYIKAKGLIESGRVEAGTLDYLSHAPADAATDDEAADRFMIWSDRLVERAVRADAAVGTRFQLELLKKTGFGDVREISNAAGLLDRLGQDEAARGIREVLLDRFPTTSAAAGAAVKLAWEARLAGDPEEARRMARLVWANPAADAVHRRRVGEFLTPQEQLGGPPPDAPLAPAPDPAFSGGQRADPE